MNNKNDIQINRNNSFNFWRIIFTFVIIIFHTVNGTDFYDRYPIFQYHWYIAVEFFFVLSGYLLMQHLESHPEETTWQYTAHRISRLFPEYFIICLLRAVVDYATDGPIVLLYRILINWQEFFMLQSVGTNTFPYINNPGWYVSSLLICGHLIYYLIRNHKKAFIEFIGPIVVILSFSYMYRNYASLGNFYETKGIFMNSGILRGMMSITLGVFAYELSIKIRPILTKTKATVLFALEIASYLFVLVFSILTSETKHDFLFLFIIFIAVTCSSVNSFMLKLCRCRIVMFFNEISYTMYLSHFIAFRLTGLFYKSDSWEWIKLPIILGITVFISLIIHYSIKSLIYYITCKKQN